MGLILSNNIQEAIGEIQKIGVENSLYDTSQLLLTRCFIEENKFDQALQLLENIIIYFQEKKSPLLINALYFKSLCNFFLGEYENSYKFMTQIQSIQMSFPFSDSFLTYLKSFPFTTNKGLAATALINLWDKFI